jgi:Ca2+-binding RTX toxin-like protein
VTLIGNELANIIFGGRGNDTIDGGGGADALWGMGGNDSFVFHLGEANNDRVVDFSAGDTLDFFGYGAGTLTEVGTSAMWLVTADAAHGGASEVLQLDGVVALNPGDYVFHV